MNKHTNKFPVINLFYEPSSISLRKWTNTVLWSSRGRHGHHLTAASRRDCNELLRGKIKHWRILNNNGVENNYEDQNYYCNSMHPLLNWNICSMWCWGIEIFWCDHPLCLNLFPNCSSHLQMTSVSIFIQFRASFVSLSSCDMPFFLAVFLNTVLSSSEVFLLFLSIYHSLQNFHLFRCQLELLLAR